MNPADKFRQRACAELGVDADDFEASISRLASTDLESLRKIEELARDCGMFEKSVGLDVIAQAQLAELLQYEGDLLGLSVSSEATSAVRLGLDILRSGKQLEALGVAESESLHELSRGVSQKAAWISIATSIGREASVPSLIRMLSEKLQIPVVKYRSSMKPHVVTKFEWTTSVSSSLETQPRFSPIHIATGSFCKKIASFLQNTGEKLQVAVSAIHNFSENSVGWCTFLVKKDIEDEHKTLDTKSYGY